MAHKKAGGSTRNGRDSESKRLGVKRYGVRSGVEPALRGEAGIACWVPEGYIALVGDDGRPHRAVERAMDCASA